MALFKLSRTVSAPLRLFVLAHVYQIPLSAGTVAIFLVTIVVLSFGTVGLPSGVLPIPTQPAYLAAGSRSRAWSSWRRSTRSRTSSRPS